MSHVSFVLLPFHWKPIKKRLKLYKWKHVFPTTGPIPPPTITKITNAHSTLTSSSLNLLSSILIFSFLTQHIFINLHYHRRTTSHLILSYLVSTYLIVSELYLLRSTLRLSSRARLPLKLHLSPGFNQIQAKTKQLQLPVSIDYVWHNRPQRGAQGIDYYSCCYPPIQKHLNLVF